MTGSRTQANRAPTEREVLIVGAGPTGLTLACGLLASGVAAHVVDWAVEPAGTSRALGLLPRGLAHRPRRASS